MNTIDLRVPPVHILRVYIWPTLKRLRSECKKRDRDKDSVNDDAIGWFQSRRTRMTWRGRIKGRIVAEIHMAKGHDGIEVFSHELQHFLSWWFTIKRFDLTGKDWERASRLAGRLQWEFWVKFYKLGLEKDAE